MAETTAVGIGDLYICDLQGDVFRSYFEEGYDMKAFVDGFMNMNPNRPDWGWVEKTPCRGDDVAYDADAAEWIGFSYSFLALRTGKTSDDLLRLAPFDWMLKIYHSVSNLVEERAVEVLMNMLSEREGSVG